MSRDTLLEVRVVCLREEAPGIVSCELRATSGALPECPAGAHVDVHLPNGLVRQYSVASARAASYVIAVKKEPAGRGGSAYVADNLRIGTVLQIGAPRQNYALDTDAARSVLIAGGIGITPLIAMARALDAQGRDWVLHYAVREPEHVIFRDELGAWKDRVRIHVSSQAGTRLPLAQIVAGEAPHAHFYCCGPASMLDAFDEAVAAVPPAQVHVERFAAAKPADGSEFTVRLARSGITIPVATNQTIVDALVAAGVDAPYSCQQGICGSCEVKVLEGTPDHRDEVLTQAEKDSNATMMLCCSRALTGTLVIDL
jgi:ferredoxin-NADP reductase